MALIGILGGTFNPIHKGHIQIAQSAYEQYHLDEIWFMPNHIPTYKQTNNIVSGKDRLNMIVRAIRDIPYFRASDFECNRDGITYTWETLTLLKKEYPMHTFYFIMGADSLFDFQQWKHPERIVQLAQILVASRQEATTVELLQRISVLESMYDCSCFHLLNCSPVACSSSQIRSELQRVYSEGHKNSSMLSLYLDEDVLTYIFERQLYISIEKM